MDELIIRLTAANFPDDIWFTITYEEGDVGDEQIQPAAGGVCEVLEAHTVDFDAER